MMAVADGRCTPGPDGRADRADRRLPTVGAPATPWRHAPGIAFACRWCLPGAALDTRLQWRPEAGWTAAGARRLARRRWRKVRTPQDRMLANGQASPAARHGATESGTENIPPQLLSQQSLR